MPDDPKISTDANSVPSNGDGKNGGISIASRLGFGPAKSAEPPSRRVPEHLKLKPGPRPKIADTPLSGSPKPAPVSVSKSEASKTRRADFEALITNLVLATTDEKSKHRLEVLSRVLDKNLAIELAEKVKLNDVEKKTIGEMSGRLWEKYVGADFEYSDEMMTAVIVGSYYLRNREGAKLEREINANADAKRSGVQGAPGISPGNNGDGKVDAH